MFEGLQASASGHNRVAQVAAGVMLTGALVAPGVLAPETAHGATPQNVATGVEAGTTTPTNDYYDKWHEQVEASLERAKDLTIRREDGKLKTVAVDGDRFAFICNEVIDGWATAVKTYPIKASQTPFNASVAQPKMCADGRISNKEARKAKKVFRGLLGSFLQV